MELWAAVGSRVAVPARADLWTAVADRLDLGGFVPCPATGVVSRRLASRDGSTYHVLRSPSRQYLRLDEEDFALWSRMDGRRSVREIATAHFVERGAFAAARLGRLIPALRSGGFLDQPLLDVFGAVEHRRRERTLAGRLGRWLEPLLLLRLYRLGDPDRVFGAAYRVAGWLAYTRPARLLWAMLVVVGLAVWWWQFLLAEHSLFQTRGSYTLGLITLAVLDVAGVNLYVLAQGLTIKHQGRQINGAGLALYYLCPVVYVETSDAWLAERRQRMAVSWSGPWAMLVLASILAILARPLDGTEMGAFLFKAATIWLANAVFNLLPILDLDGYFMLVDYFDMPALRANSLQFLRSGLRPALRAGRRLTREERIYAAFGLLSAGLLLLIPLLILAARDLRYADTLVELWNSPSLGAELQAVAMAALLLGPAAVDIARQIAATLYGLALVLWRAWQRWRGEVPADQVEALAELPFLRGVPRPELVLIARHLEPRAARPGQVLIRQGAYADRFFLIRSGTVRVDKLTPDGRTVRLARLGAGEHFGETALLERVPRTAQVVAETDVRLLTLDGGHFRRWIGDRLEVAAAVRRSLAERERLATLPLLRDAEPADLDRLIPRLLVTRYSAGDVIVRQGEPGDRFYLLIEGRVEVVRETEQGSTRVAELGPGDYVGEMALLRDEPRSATVRALTPVEAYSLTAADFRALLGGLPAAERIRATAAERAGTLGLRPARAIRRAS